jgi:hypothetical protein
MKKIKSTIKASELECLFDEGGDITAHLDYSSARRPALEQKRGNVDFPQCHETPSPEWHGDVLSSRLAKVEAGEGHFLTIEELKSRLASKQA